MRLKTGRTPSASRARAHVGLVAAGERRRGARRRSPRPSARADCRRRPAGRAARTRASSARMSAIALEEPGVDLGRPRAISVDAHAEPQRLRDHRAAGRASASPIAARSALASSPLPRPSISISSRPVRPVSSERSAFCSDFGEGAADRHRLADRLHRGGQHRLGAGEFLEREARDLGDDIVDGRLERGRRRAAGDVVGDLVERVADGELGRDLGDRESRSPSRRAPRSATRAGSSR